MEKIIQCLVNDDWKYTIKDWYIFYWQEDQIFYKESARKIDYVENFMIIEVKMDMLKDRCTILLDDEHIYDERSEELLQTFQKCVGIVSQLQEILFLEWIGKLEVFFEASYIVDKDWYRVEPEDDETDYCKCEENKKVWKRCGSCFKIKYVESIDPWY